MKKGKLKIGITGSIGSGKSMFADYLKEKGFPVINADELSKEILASDLTVIRKIKKEFGENSYTNNGVNKKFLAGQIFSDKAKLQRINSILHPAVIKKTDLLCDEYFSTNNFVFVESALIYEVKIEKLFDYIVVIAADTEIRKKRILSSARFSADQFKRRDANQLDQEIKIKKADFVFYNNDSVSELQKKAEFLLFTIKTISDP
ncbi:MAG TPA: dephospho-CoA kinase [Ignavibacteriaceae bacterium]|nr:dephospho-CoA kinase [Ignavibacteriaceae bacterium]